MRPSTPSPFAAGPVAPHPMDVLPELMAALRRTEIGFAEAHDVLTLAQAFHLREDGNPLFRGWITVSGGRPRVSGLSTDRPEWSSGAFRPANDPRPSGADPERVRRAVALLRGLPPDRIREMASSESGPFGRIGSDGSKVKLGDLRRLGEALVRASGQRLARPAASGAPQARVVFHQLAGTLGEAASDEQVLMRAMALAQGRHRALYARDLYSDPVIWTGELFSIRTLKSDVRNRSSRKIAEGMGPEERERAVQALAPFVQMGAAGTAALAASPGSPFRKGAGRISSGLIASFLAKAHGGRETSHALGAPRRPSMGASRSAPTVVVVKRRAIAAPSPGKR